MSTIKIKTAGRRSCSRETQKLRIRGFSWCSALWTIVLLLSAIPTVAACSPQGGLHLSASIENHELVAVLTNTSNNRVRTVGKRITAIPGSGGFYVVLHHAGGAQVKYCAIINSENPAQHWLGPNEKVVYRDTVASIANQYCLQPGKYTGKVVYYNSLMFGEKPYSEPIMSGVFEIVVPNKEDAKRGELR